MRFPILKLFFVVLLLVLAPRVVVQAEEWMRGAVAVASVSGDVVVEEVGGEPIQLSATRELPVYFSGLLKVQSNKRSEAVFLKASNRISMYNSGAGFFAIERFGQEVGASAEQAKSRMILNLRQGLLVVDHRAMGEGSQMIVETPLGRISAKKGWWLMEIAYDASGHIYNFFIECADGVLRFTDCAGATYTLRRGQRLTGAGTSMRPAIQVSELSERASRRFEAFSVLQAEADSLELSTHAFSAKMRPMNTVTQQERPAATVESFGAAEKRPLIIKYAPQSPPVSPFRAVIRAPSLYEADLF